MSSEEIDEARDLFVTHCSEFWHNVEQAIADRSPEVRANFYLCTLSAIMAMAINHWVQECNEEPEKFIGMVLLNSKRAYDAVNELNAGTGPNNQAH